MDTKRDNKLMSSAQNLSKQDDSIKNKKKCLP